ncbi:hypothetical protein MMC30_004037 [Trapelia coarctata]|nr:hypothetical protein [Trapelia coarctata]
MANYMAGEAKNGPRKTETFSLNKDKPIEHSAKDPATLGREELKRGEEEGQHSDYQSVIDLYTSAISTNPQAPEYYIQRSTAYTRLKPPQLARALSDAEAAVMLAHKRCTRELISAAQLRRAITLARLRRYGDALQSFDWGFDRAPEGSIQENDSWFVKLAKGLAKEAGIYHSLTKSRLLKLKGTDAEAQMTIKEVPEQNTSSVSGHTTAPQIPTSKGDQVEKKLEGVQTLADKIRHEWFQNQENVTINLLAKGIPQDKAIVDIQPHSLTISFPLPTGSDFDFSLDPLYAEIDPTASTYKITPTKVECTLKKVIIGQKWRSPESTGPLSSTQNSTSTATDDAVKRAVLSRPVNATAPAYPTSSRTGPKNWDKLADELTKRPAKKAESSDTATDDPNKAKSETADAEDWVDDEGGDPATGFFKKLFQNADPDTRRAMMKSYQESNGTALSTNWDEVGKKKMETSPPDGMVAKKWGE